MIEKNENILIFNPPGKLYLRGEDRCQADVEGSAAVSLRAPNDLGYIAAVTKELGLYPVIRDYPAEKLDEAHYLDDILAIKPKIIVMSITASTIMEDVHYFRKAKEADPEICTIAKGALFFACPPEVLDRTGGESLCIDVAVCGEAETIIPPVIESLRKGEKLENVRGIIYFDKELKIFKKTAPAPFVKDPNKIPFPARELMKNELYVRPDTGRPMATITTSRGCPESCIYCLSPVISGKSLRMRSPKNIVNEVQECTQKYDIFDFFFMADTFTLNKPWVIEICQEILRRGLKIHWVANSRVCPLDEERLQWMKKAGCWLISFGIESGSEESLAKMKKGATKSDAREAVRMARKAGLKIYGYYIIGFPWEDHRNVKETLNFAKELSCDFSEIHIAAPFQGTELFDILSDYGLALQIPYGYNYFSNPPVGTKYLTIEELIRYRKNSMRDLYLNPSYIFKTLKNIRTVEEFKNYSKYGLRLLKNLYGHCD